MAQRILELDLDRIVDWDSFHTVFKQMLGFPDYNGRHMDAWIDCMTSLHDPMRDSEWQPKAVRLAADEILVLHMQKARAFKTRCPEIFEAIVECGGFVNWRRVSKGLLAQLTLSFYA